MKVLGRLVGYKWHRDDDAIVDIRTWGSGMILQVELEIQPTAVESTIAPRRLFNKWVVLDISLPTKLTDLVCAWCGKRLNPSTGPYSIYSSVGSIPAGLRVVCDCGQSTNIYPHFEDGIPEYFIERYDPKIDEILPRTQKGVPSGPNSQ